MDNLKVGDRIFLMNDDGSEHLYEVLSVTEPPRTTPDVGIYDLTPLDGGRIRSMQFHEWRLRVLYREGRTWRPGSGRRG